MPFQRCVNRTNLASEWSSKAKESWSNVLQSSFIGYVAPSIWANKRVAFENQLTKTANPISVPHTRYRSLGKLVALIRWRWSAVGQQNSVASRNRFCCQNKFRCQRDCLMELNWIEFGSGSWFFPVKIVEKINRLNWASGERRDGRQCRQWSRISSMAD